MSLVDLCLVVQMYGQVHFGMDKKNCTEVSELYLVSNFDVEMDEIETIASFVLFHSGNGMY